MRFEVCILGSNAATFAFGRHVSAQVINIREHLFLVDCGEGTQIRLQDMRIKSARIQHIFISHMHGDHIFGLIGLINSFALMGRQVPLHIYGPVELEQFIRVQLQLTHAPELPFPLHFYANLAEKETLLYENNILSVYAFPLKHRIPTHGFLFREKEGLRRLIKEKLEEYNIPTAVFNSLKEGSDYVMPDTGRIISNAELTLPPAKSRTYAYCSDTAFLPNLIETLTNIDLLYHEATFLEEHRDKAAATFHSTAKQAASIAKLANVKQLLLGHFSSRYEELSVLLQEAQGIFPATELALEGRFFSIPYDTLKEEKV